MPKADLETGISTLADVAQRAGVAPATASYVLNNKPKAISGATRERVLTAAREIGYRPNMAARSLITRRKNIIALWVPDVSSAFSSRVIAEIQRQARRSAYEVLISEIHRDERLEQSTCLYDDPPAATVRMPLWNVDGILAFLGSACRNVQFDLPAASQTPTVSMGAFPIEGTDFVGVELRSGADAAMRTLLAAGCQRLGYLVPAHADFLGDDRREAYVAAMRNAGREPIFLRMAGGSRAAARAATAEGLRQHPALDGLFCYNDDAAIGAYRALRDAGRRVPEDVSLIGCDGIEDTEYLDCPLSTLVLPLEEMCATAWRFLEQRLQEAPAAPQRAIYSGQLALRESVALPP